MRLRYSILLLVVTLYLGVQTDVFGNAITIKLCYGEPYIADFYDAQHNPKHIEVSTPDDPSLVQSDGTILYHLYGPTEGFYNQDGSDVEVWITWSPYPDISDETMFLCTETQPFDWGYQHITPPFKSEYHDYMADPDGCVIVDRKLHVTLYEKRTDTLHLKGVTCDVTTPTNPYHYKWPDGFEEDFIQGILGEKTYEHMIKSQLPCNCDSLLCDFTLRYVAPKPIDYDVVLCTNAESVYVPRFDAYFKGLGDYDREVMYPNSDCVDTIYHIHVKAQDPPLYSFEKDTFPCYKEEGFEWHEKHIIDEGTYKDTIRATLCDCDSVITTIYVKYNYSDEVTENIYVCAGETIKHVDRSDPTLPVEVYVSSEKHFVESEWKNIFGCDSIHRTNYYFSAPPTPKDTTFTICAGDTFIEYGSKRSITETGIYYDTIFCRLGKGCDSILWKYNVTRLDTTNSFENFQTCYTDRPFQWHGKEYYRSTRDKDTLVNSMGCDSFCYMNLYVTDAPYNELHDTIMCLGHPFMWGNKFVDAKGTYIDTMNNVYSCDSVYRIIKVDTSDCCTHLTQLELVKPFFCADTKDYTMALEYTGGMPRDYILTFDYHGRQNGFHDASYEYKPYEASENYANIAVSFDYSESQYIIPDGYECKVTVVDTCERPFKYELIDTINVRYPSWIIEQHLSNTFALLNDKYNGGYIFSSYQWYADDKPIIGATQSYVSVYSKPFENVAYSVFVVRENDGVGAFSCPVYLKTIQMESAITEHYILVKPTVISAANPTTYIEGNIGGVYIVYDIVGRKLCSDTFEEGATTIDIPVTSSQALFLRVTLKDGSEETFILLVQ